MLPKVLIIGQPFTRNTGGGITLTNLFAGWDKSRIAVACSPYLLAGSIDTSICDTYYQLGEKENKWVFPFNLFNKKYSSGLIKPAAEEEKQKSTAIEKKSLRVQLIVKFFRPALKFGGLNHAAFRTNLSKEFCDWLDEFNPDVIYAQATSRESVLFCTMVHTYLNKPMIFHMMDDWPSTISGKGFSKKFWQKKIDREFKSLLDKASILMSISEQMAHEYKRRYHKDFITFHNPIDSDFWGKYQRKDYRLSSSPAVLYAGRIGLGIESSLELIAKAIQKINADTGSKARFVLQTNTKPAWTNKYACIEYKNFVPYDELPRLFSESDFLILPYDFSQEAINFIKYSMPTKATEYMASGTPIIVFAPKETAIVDYAVKYNWAKVVTENNANALIEALKNLIRDENERKEITKNAKELVNKKHNSAVVRNDFKKIVASLFPEQ